MTKWADLKKNKKYKSTNNLFQSFRKGHNYLTTSLNDEYIQFYDNES